MDVMDYERRSLVPQRTYSVSRSNLISSRNKVVKADQKTLYNVHASTHLLKSSSTITIRQSENTKGPIVASAVLRNGQSEFEILLGDTESTEVSATQVQPDGEPFDRYFKFYVGSQPYAWQRTFRHSVCVPTTDGNVEETTGNDWKLIALEAGVPRQSDRVLAVCIQHDKPSREASIHWFEQISVDIEWSSLAAIMGMLEQTRRSQKEWGSGTSLMHT